MVMFVYDTDGARLNGCVYSVIQEETALLWDVIV